MKNIIFRKGARLVKELTLNKWVLHCNNMSGDGDHYEETTRSFDNCDKIWDFIYLYITPWVMEGDRYSDIAVMKAVEERGKDLFKYPTDVYSDMVGWDITNESFHASPQKAWITYFDENGNEFAVEIIVGNKCFGVIEEYNIKEILDEH